MLTNIKYGKSKYIRKHKHEYKKTNKIYYKHYHYANKKAISDMTKKLNGFETLAIRPNWDNNGYDLLVINNTTQQIDICSIEDKQINNYLVKNSRKIFKTKTKNQYKTGINNYYNEKYKNKKSKKISNVSIVSQEHKYDNNIILPNDYVSNQAVVPTAYLENDGYNDVMETSTVIQGNMLTLMNKVCKCCDWINECMFYTSDRWYKIKLECCINCNEKYCGCDSKYSLYAIVCTDLLKRCKICALKWFPNMIGDKIEQVLNISVDGDVLNILSDYCGWKNEIEQKESRKYYDIEKSNGDCSKINVNSWYHLMLIESWNSLYQTLFGDFDCCSCWNDSYRYECNHRKRRNDIYYSSDDESEYNYYPYDDSNYIVNYLGRRRYEDKMYSTTSTSWYHELEYKQVSQYTDTYEEKDSYETVDVYINKRNWYKKKRISKKKDISIKKKIGNGCNNRKRRNDIISNRKSMKKLINNYCKLDSSFF